MATKALFKPNLKEVMNENRRQNLLSLSRVLGGGH